jgi:carboxypeptidase family protein
VTRAVGLTALLLILPMQGSAQAIFGEIFDAVGGQPVVVAEVWLIDAEGTVVARALSDSTGEFRIAWAPGVYVLAVSGLGYQSRYIMDIPISDGNTGPLEIGLSASALSLDGLSVEVGATNRSLRLQGYYERKKLGLGSFIEVDKDDRSRSLKPTDLTRMMPGVRTQDGEVFGRGCLLQILLDGMYVGTDMDAVTIVADIQAVEVYRGISQVPIQWQSIAVFGDWLGRRGLRPTCGIVAVWTRSR